MSKKKNFEFIKDDPLWTLKWIHHVIDNLYYEAIVNNNSQCLDTIVDIIDTIHGTR